MSNTSDFTELQAQKMHEVCKILDEHFDAAVVGFLVEDGNNAKVEHMSHFSFGKASGAYILADVLTAHVRSKVHLKGPTAV
jgi:hypothetical protein